MNLRTFATAVGVVIAAASVRSASANASPKHVTLNFAMIQPSMSLFQTVPLKIAVSKGMLAQEGITLKFVPLEGTSQMVAALDSGKAEIAYTAMNDLVSAVMKGAKAVAVVGGPENPIYSVVSKPSIKTFSELKGKPIAVSLPGDIITIATKEIVDKHGFVDNDYVAKVIISTKLRAKCLTKGDCAAATLAQPFDINLANRGYHILATSHEVIPNLQYTVYAALPSWARGYKDILIRFARAMSAAYKYVEDPAHKKDVISAGMTMTGASKDVAAKIYHMYFEQSSGVLPKHGEINMDGVKKVISLMGGAGALKKPLPSAGRFVDLRYLEAAGLQ